MFGLNTFKAAMINAAILLIIGCSPIDPPDDTAASGSSSSSSSTTSSSSSSSSSTTSSSSSSSSSSGDVIFIGQLTCNLSLPSNWPCEYLNGQQGARCSGGCTDFFSRNNYYESVPPCHYTVGNCSTKDSYGLYHIACDNGGCTEFPRPSGSSSSSGGPRNLVSNPSMDEGIEPWRGTNAATIDEHYSLDRNDDFYSLQVYNRLFTAAGVRQRIENLERTSFYSVRAHIFIDGPDDHSINVKLRNTAYSNQSILSFSVEGGGWHIISGTFDVKEGGTHDLIFDNVSSSTPFYLDNVFLEQKGSREITVNQQAVIRGRSRFVELDCMGCHDPSPYLATQYPIDIDNLSLTTKRDLPVYIHQQAPHDMPATCENECAIDIAAFLYSCAYKGCVH